MARRGNQEIQQLTQAGEYVGPPATYFIARDSDEFKGWADWYRVVKQQYDEEWPWFIGHPTEEFKEDR